MKSLFNYIILASLVLFGVTVTAQNRSLDNYREPDKKGVNVFEAPKTTETTFNGIKVRTGGSSTLQLQAIDHENSNAVELQGIGTNFNLATANLDFDVALAPGVRMHLRTYLSSRHHPEPYVKGGYFQIDNLDFVKKGLLEDLMKHVTIKIGHMENNYGDAHFRRSDNAQAIYNPFVGNLIMDAFTTEVGAEVYYFSDSGFFGMLGYTNGKLNQSVKEGNDGLTGGGVFLTKLGYDKQLNNDVRVRLTGSLYNTGYIPRIYLYSADRTGSRYYGVMVEKGADDNFRSGRFAPSFRNSVTAIMINPFIKYGGLEFFGTYESATGKSSADTDTRNTTQMAGEVIYRFGKTENFYIGGRYNTVDSEEKFGTNMADVNISRFQLGGGWFLTNNILVKGEYVNQQYEGYPTGNILEDGKFSGFIFEAVISF